MSPDTPEGRERIARIEERVDANRRQIEMLGPLPQAVGRIQWRLDELVEDLKRREAAIDRRLDQRDVALKEWQEKFERSIGGQFAACSSEIAKVAETMRAHHHAEHVRREREDEQAREDAKAAQRSRTERWIAKYGLIGILGAATITASATIVNTIIS